VVVKSVLVGIWVLLLGSGLRAVTEKTTVYADRDYDVLAAPPLARLDERAINVLTLGHRGLYDDAINIWLLQSLADERLRAKTPEEIHQAMRLVIDLHPKIESIYMLSCFILAMDLKKPELCEQISLAGLKALPDSWRIPVTQGFIFYKELGDPKKAALYYGLAASRPEAPEFLGALTKTLIEKNQMSIPELESTLDHLLDAPGGSKFSKYLQGRKP
jgi:hypothetical protein